MDNKSVKQMDNYISIGHKNMKHVPRNRSNSTDHKDESWLMVLFHTGTFCTVDDDEVTPWLLLLPLPPPVPLPPPLLAPLLLSSAAGCNH